MIMKIAPTILERRKGKKYKSGTKSKGRKLSTKMLTHVMTLVQLVDMFNSGPLLGVSTSKLDGRRVLSAEAP
jgi:hypothetical protein